MSEREEAAKLVLAMMNQRPWCDQPWSRAALGAAARAIQRGRLLSEREKLLNLANAFAEDDPKDDVARRIREAANRGCH